MNCRFCNKECKNDNSLRNHERLCKSNPNRQLTSYEKYGPIEGFNNFGRKAWNSGLTKETDARVMKSSQTLANRYAKNEIIPSAKGTHKSDFQREKISKAMIDICKTRNCSLCGKGKRGYYKGYWCQSSWELAYVIYNIEHGIKFSRNKKRFPYYYNGKQRSYFPDFYLDDLDTYVEIKGFYDEKTKAKQEQFKGKLLMLKAEDIKEYLDYCKDKYGENFTELYDVI